MKARFKFLLIMFFVILCLVIGFLFKEETFVFSLFDNYFIIDYLTFSIYITYVVLFFLILNFILLKFKKKN